MRFIVIDGLDAAGKDTHALMIKERYEAAGEKVILRSHPTSDNPFGRKAKKALLGTGKKNKFIASTYYAADIFRSVKRHYGKADTVIFVRYLCGVAYLPSPFHKSLYNIFSGILPTTEYLFFLDVSPRESLKRIECRDEVEMFENLESLQEVREKVIDLVKDWYIIDTDQPMDKAHNDIDRILDVLDSGGDLDENKPSVLHDLKERTSSPRR
ncbi:MAG: thymidylate kinase [Thermoplasmata archaeon]